MGVARQLDIEKKTSVKALHHATSNKSKWQAKNIRKPAENDVLCGRGGKGNFHKGNERFRELVWKYNEAYSMCSTKAEKTVLSLDILDKWKGRFLELNKETGNWDSVARGTARRKVSQRLRDNKERKEKGLVVSKQQQAKEKTSKKCKSVVSKRRVTPEEISSSTKHEKVVAEQNVLPLASSLKDDKTQKFSMDSKTNNERNVDDFVSTMHTTKTIESQQDDSTTKSLTIDSMLEDDELCCNDLDRTFSESMDYLIQVAQQQEGDEDMFGILDYEGRGTAYVSSWDESESSLHSSISTFDDEPLMLTPPHRENHAVVAAESELTPQQMHYHSYNDVVSAGGGGAHLVYQHQQEHPQEGEQRQERNYLDDLIPPLERLEDDKDLDKLLQDFFELTTL